MAAALLPAMLTACGLVQGGSGTPAPESRGWEAVKEEPAESSYREGAGHFSRGDYGLAEKSFREAVEKAPKDARPWIGLAASYDRLGRFDLADHAYAAAIKLSGETAEILNNQGYSYMLRGNLPAARAKLLKAQALEPGNQLVRNNIKLLEKHAGPAAP